MRIGIIGPSKQEIMPFISNLNIKNESENSMMSFFEGAFNNIEVVATICGICKVNASVSASLLIDVYKCSHIIIIGVAGAIDKNLKIFDCVISDKACYHDVLPYLLEEDPPYMKKAVFTADSKMIADIKNSYKQKLFVGKIVTGESFITKDNRDTIIKKFNPLVVDMETAAVAHVCYLKKVSFVSIRTVTDTKDLCGIEEFRINLVKCAQKSIDVLESYIGNL
ncbi:MAG: 5'-methylthioadenosine/S-adenosylhomocysteine nucleosidase [Bacilli bacterium]